MEVPQLNQFRRESFEAQWINLHLVYAWSWSLPAGCWQESEFVLGPPVFQRRAVLDGCTAAGQCLAAPARRQHTGETKLRLVERSFGPHRGHSHFPALGNNNDNHFLSV